MTDDLADVIAAELWGAFGEGTDSPDDWAERGDDIAAAVRAHYIALGGVTDARMQIDTARAIVASDGMVNMEPLWEAVGDLIARAVGHACAERDAEIERLTQAYRTFRYVAERERAEAAEAERDALRATVTYVRNLHRSVKVATSGSSDPKHRPTFRVECSCGTPSCATRAALDGEA
jgi:hypothetical protein